jgi:hypothetical protein
VLTDFRSIGEWDWGSALLRNGVGSDLHGRFDSHRVPKFVDPTNFFRICNEGRARRDSKVGQAGLKEHAWKATPVARANAH